MYHNMQWFGLYGMLGLVLQGAVLVLQCAMVCNSAMHNVLHGSKQWLVLFVLQCAMDCIALCNGLY